MADEPDLDSAYALETPDDNRQLYRAWAESYDADFVAAALDALGFPSVEGVADVAGEEVPRLTDRQDCPNRSGGRDPLT